MKLTTEKALDYYQAFVRLDGYPRGIATPQGPQVIVDSYDLSPKVKWRCVINRELLQVVKNGFDREKKAEQTKFDDYKMSLDPKLEDKERELLLDTAQLESNARLATLAQQENEIPGLVTLPGEGIRIRARDPGIIAILALIRKDFIEGEPDYGQERPKVEKELKEA